MRAPTQDVWEKHKVDIQSALKGFIQEDDVLMSSKEFTEVYARFIVDLALYERDRRTKAKGPRNLSYAKIGVMNEHDLIQEAYLSFFMAYNNLNRNHEKIVNAPDDEKGAIVWGFLKGSTIQKFEERVRESKDGIKVPRRETFDYKDSPNKIGGVNTNYLTKTFSQLDKIFFTNQEQSALTNAEQDLMGLFLEVQMDKYLDVKKNGEVNPKGIERDVLKRLFGIDCAEEGYSTLEEDYKKSVTTLAKVKQRALDKLRTEECRLEIAEFAYSYKMSFSTWFDKGKKQMVTPGIYEWLRNYRENSK